MILTLGKTVDSYGKIAIAQKRGRKTIAMKTTFRSVIFKPKQQKLPVLLQVSDPPGSDSGVLQTASLADA
jgi:hypothetical protein